MAMVSACLPAGEAIGVFAHLQVTGRLPGMLNAVITAAE
jgi:hypothetical protein